MFPLVVVTSFRVNLQAVYHTNQCLQDFNSRGCRVYQAHPLSRRSASLSSQPLLLSACFLFPQEGLNASQRSPGICIRGQQIKCIYKIILLSTAIDFLSSSGTTCKNTQQSFILVLAGCSLGTCACLFPPSWGRINMLCGAQCFEPMRQSLRGDL